MNLSSSILPCVSLEGRMGMPPKILIIEENPAIEELLRVSLAVEGYENIVTARELKTVAHIHQNGGFPRLVLLDIDCSRVWMKTVESLWDVLQEQYAATSRCQAKRVVAHPTFIILTCNPKKKDALEASDSLVLMKPFHPRDLLYYARTVLDHQAMEARIPVLFP